MILPSLGLEAGAGKQRLDGLAPSHARQRRARPDVVATIVQIGQDHTALTREDTDHLAEHGARARQGRKDAFRQHGVEGAGRERQLFGPARHELEIGPGRPCPADLRRRGVGPDRPQSAAIREVNDGGAAAAADVEHTRAPWQPGQIDDPVGELETAGRRQAAGAGQAAPAPAPRRGVPGAAPAGGAHLPPCGAASPRSQ